MASDPTVEERLMRLEHTVAELQRMLAAGATTPAGAGAATGGGAAVNTAGAVRPWAAPHGAAGGRPDLAAAASPPPSSPGRDWVAIGQIWIGRAGVALLLLGLGFLYRYAVVRGWLTPVLRVTFGGVVGFTLLGLGLRLHVAKTSRAYGLLLLGGGIAVVYLSAFAAFGFYRLVPASVAVVALAALTLVAVRLAANREEPLLAHMGASGAFFAPLLVHGQHPSLPLLASYVALVVVWTGWTAVREGWRILAWTTLGGAALLLVMGGAAARTALDRELLSVAALLSGPGLVAALLWRERAIRTAADRWKRRAVRPAALRAWWSEAGDPTAAAIAADLLSATTLAAVAALLFSLYVGRVMQWPREAMGSLALIGAVLLGACAWAWRDSPALARALALSAAAPLLVGTGLLDLTTFRGVFALEALVLLLLGTRAPAPRLTILGHIVFAGVALLYMTFLAETEGLAVPGVVLIADLASVAAALYASSFLRDLTAARTYAMASLLALLAWLAVALEPLPGGQYLVTVAWGILASALLLTAWRRADARFRAGALIALAAVALKLLLVDTAALPAGGRVVVFIGFGALFLLLGALYRRGAIPARAPAAPPPPRS